MANPPELGLQPRLGYTASLLDRMAQRRDDEAAIKKLSEHERAGVYVIGGELIVLLLRGAGRRLIVRHPSRAVRRVLELTGFDAELQIEG